MRRGPVGGPPRPYTPATFGSLFLWWIVLLCTGTLLSIVIIGLPMLVASIVLYYVFLYKAWNQIQDGYQRTSAGKAVGFCFIPLFNVYWLFVAVYGLAVDMNAYIRRYQIPAPQVSEGLALTLCILLLCTIVPWLGLLAALAVFIITIIVMHQFKLAAAGIAAAKLHAMGAQHGGR